MRRRRSNCFFLNFSFPNNRNLYRRCITMAASLSLSFISNAVTHGKDRGSSPKYVADTLDFHWIRAMVSTVSSVMRMHLFAFIVNKRSHLLTRAINPFSVTFRLPAIVMDSIDFADSLRDKAVRVLSVILSHVFNINVFSLGKMLDEKSGCSPLSVTCLHLVKFKYFRGRITPVCSAFNELSLPLENPTRKGSNGMFRCELCSTVFVFRPRVVWLRVSSIHQRQLLSVT